ncbi:MAG TPA: AraC family transcriptional regulator [Rhizobiaceae bacterium]|nr:AraC family transcriptional regulator [Rhizobiaceae bacterium]
MDTVATKDAVVRVGDLVRRPGLTFESHEDFSSLDAPLFHGQFWHRELRRGLVVHASDVFEDAGFTAVSSQHEGLSCIFFVDGDVEVEIGERSFRFRGDGRLREGLVLPSVRAESFRRHSPGRQRIKHLVVTVSPEWLDRDGLASVDDSGTVSTALGAHLEARSWHARPRLAELVERILRLGGSQSGLHQLLVESAAVEIVAEALASTTGQEPTETRQPNLSSRDRARLRRAQEFIDADIASWPSVEAIAREAGLSPSGLQRLFKSAHGISVLEHIRRTRLERARRALADGECTIQEAAFMAGYSGAANFATAFKRHFGQLPSQIAKTWR